jgi:drug/metabolite transporter (DMT)-like permease
MDLHYIIGVVTAIFCGICMEIGILIQKKVVNDISVEDRKQRFLVTLLKNPRWMGGLILEYGVGSAAYMIAQNLIGPALVPGLMAAGLIVLAIGSVKIIGETLSFSEYLGIALLIAGIALLGLSELEIRGDVVRTCLASSGMIKRIAILTTSLFVLWALTHLQSLKLDRRKGIVMAFSNGFPFAISNLWISPLLAVFAAVMSGRGNWQQVAIFILASIILVGCNVLGIRQTNEAFKFAQASNIIPVQQVSVQLTPILFYFYVYALTPPKAISGVLIIAGVALILAAVFLLGRRQAEIEMMP